MVNIVLASLYVGIGLVALGMAVVIARKGRSITNKSFALSGGLFALFAFLNALSHLELFGSVDEVNWLAILISTSFVLAPLGMLFSAITIYYGEYHIRNKRLMIATGIYTIVQLLIIGVDRFFLTGHDEVLAVQANAANNILVAGLTTVITFLFYKTSQPLENPLKRQVQMLVGGFGLATIGLVVFSLFQALLLDSFLAYPLIIILAGVMIALISFERQKN